MKILHVSSHDLHGSRFNGYDMIDSLKNGHQVEMAVWHKESESLNVHLLPPTNIFVRELTRRLIYFFSRLGFDRLFGYAGFLLPSKKYFISADVLHLHLIHSLSNFSILTLPLVTRLKPTVWTLHDPWAITGGCEHSFDCEKWINGCTGRCPYPRTTSFLNRYTPRFHWKLKKYLYSKSNLNIVVASQWMMDRVQKSPLLKDFSCHLIPFGVDINLFKRQDTFLARKKLGISPTDRVIAFRDPGLKKDKFKGMKWLMEALCLYEPDKSTTLLIFQDGSEFDVLSNKYNIVKTGWIHNEKLASAFSAADIFLMPSIQESFGLMAVEAMSCSLPVIVFEGSALPSVIQAPIGGIAVPAKNSFKLSKAICDLLNDDDLRSKLGVQARQLVESEYDFSLYIKRHLALYNSVLD